MFRVKESVGIIWRQANILLVGNRVIGTGMDFRLFVQNLIAGIFSIPVRNDFHTIRRSTNILHGRH